jgi:hypothetical protein
MKTVATFSDSKKNKSNYSFLKENWWLIVAGICLVIIAILAKYGLIH